MALPENSVISPEKLTKYLLILRRRNDKSKWLAQAGYRLENWRSLERDLRSQILSLDAVPTESTPYGQFFEIRGILRGPNGKSLAVSSVWMTENATGITKMITLYPDKGKKK
jgi:hypothetical protein